MGTTLILRSFSPRSAYVPASAKIVLLVVQNPFPEIYRGCMATRATKLIFVNWVIFIVMEGGMLHATRYWESWLIDTGTTQLSSL